MRRTGPEILHWGLKKNMHRLCDKEAKVCFPCVNMYRFEIIPDLLWPCNKLLYFKIFPCSINSQRTTSNSVAFVIKKQKVVQIGGLFAVVSVGVNILVFSMWAVRGDCSETWVVLLNGSSMRNLFLLRKGAVVFSALPANVCEVCRGHL